MSSRGFQDSRKGWSIMYSLECRPDHTPRAQNARTLIVPPMMLYVALIYRTNTPYRFCSCSLISRLHLNCISNVHVLMTRYLPSAGVKSVRPGHLSVTLFSFGANSQRDSSEPDNDCSYNCGIGFPVRRVRVPATGRRPDVFRVAVRV